MRISRVLDAARLLVGAALVTTSAAMAVPVLIESPPSAEAAPGDGLVTVRVVQEVNANGLVDDTIM